MLGRDGRGHATLPRPRLEHILDGALAHRLTLLTADAGFGKTTLLGAWSAELNAVIHTLTEGDADLSLLGRHVVDALRLCVPDLAVEPAATGGPRGPEADMGEPSRPEAMAELLGEALERRLTRDLALVLDNAHLVGDGPAARFLAGVVRHAPPLLHVVLAGRDSPRVPLARIADVGQVLELHGADLAFTPDEVAALVEAVLGERNVGLAESITEATAGWPVAVRLTIEALREAAPASRGGKVATLTAPKERLRALIGAVYEREPPTTRRLLGVLSLCGEAPVELCEALGIDRARETLAGLARRGLFVEQAAPGWYRLQASARDFVAGQGPLAPQEETSVRETAVGWLSANGFPAVALRTLVAAGEDKAVAYLLAEEGGRLVTDGHASAVLEAVDSLPGALRGGDLERLAGEARQLRGDWDAALDCYERAAAGAEWLDAGLAWRMGLIHHLRGELDTALAVYERGRVDGPPSPDAALLLAWTASVHWLRSDRKACGQLAARAWSMATAVGDDRALAAAHTVLAMLAALEGDRRANDAHYIKALGHAERAGDPLQRIRIHVNRSSHHAEEGAYAEALAELDVAIRLADVAGFPGLGALALSNRGETRMRLGRLEEALRDLEDAVTIFEGLGSDLVSYPLCHLGTLRYLRGEHEASRAAYERALRRSEAAGDLQGEVPALAGLARLLEASEPGEAVGLARRAVDAGDGMAYVAALLASARVALAAGDRRAAVEAARAAGAAAMTRRDLPGLAESAEIEAAATVDDKRALELAERAVSLWTPLGDPIGRARAELVCARRLDPGAAEALLTAVRGRMRAIGCRLVAAEAADALGHLGSGVRRGVRIETLGGFRVLHADGTVADGDWKSRKARQLLKLLVARRGRPAPREWLMEVLWPGEPPERVANRFNVAVSTVRSVLDRGADGAAGSAVATEGEAVRLCSDRVEIDVECFLADAAAGARLLREGRGAEALDRLERSEAAYHGDFLEADLYEDWAVALREEARFAYLEAASRLAEHAQRAGDATGAIRYLLRVLEADPYAEPTHLQLVGLLAAEGRHGDARRHYRAYCRRMDEIGVEGAPFPAR